MGQILFNRSLQKKAFTSPGWQKNAYILQKILNPYHGHFQHVLHNFGLYNIEMVMMYKNVDVKSKHRH